MIHSVCCLGAGYVGAPSLAVFAWKNPQINFYVLDISSERISKWNSSDLPIYEPGLQEIIEKVRNRNLFFSTDILRYVNESEIVFVCVNTPTKVGGIGGGHALDISMIENAARMIAPVIHDGHIIVEKSTVPVHTATAISEILKDNTKPGVEFSVLSNPEFLAEGTAIKDLLSPSRVLIGGDHQQSIERLSELYSWLPSEKIIQMSVWSSELSKLVANAFLAQRISSINSIAALCEKTGANVSDIQRAIQSDPRIGSKFLQPSIGFGGSCFQKDISCLVYLCRKFYLEDEANYWEQVIKMNDRQRKRFVEKISELMYHSLRNKHFLVLGFAFKQDTGDTRESSAIEVVNQLLLENANIHIYDPQVKFEDIPVNIQKSQFVSFQNQLQLDDLIDVDAIIICTEWEEFKHLPYQLFYQKMRKPAYIFDGRRITQSNQLRKIGFKVFQIGES